MWELGNEKNGRNEVNEFSLHSFSSCSGFGYAQPPKVFPEAERWLLGEAEVSRSRCSFKAKAYFFSFPSFSSFSSFLSLPFR
jgi:hypothetical protein